MKLYGANVCPFVHRVRLVLAEKGLEHEYVAIDLRNKPDWYHDVLPTGKVPLLEDQGERLWESDILCQYLEEAHPEPALMPKDSILRGKIRLHWGFTGSRFIPLFYKLLSAQEADKQAEYREGMLKVLEDLESHLASTSGPYLFDEFSLADVMLYPWFERWCVLEHYRDLELPNSENTGKWLAAMQARESVKALVIEKDYFIDQYSYYANGTVVPA